MGDNNQEFNESTFLIMVLFILVVVTAIASSLT